MEEEKKPPPIEENVSIPIEEVLSNRLMMEIEEQVARFVAGLNIINTGNIHHKTELGYVKISSIHLIIGDKLIFTIIKKIVCGFYDIPFNVIIKRTRKGEIVIKRQIIQYLLTQYTKCSLRYIGEITGGYNHATILSSKKVINNFIDTNRSIRNEIREMKLLIEKVISPE